MRILVCGGRDFTNRTFVYFHLTEFLSQNEDLECVIQGGAKGVDSFALDWAIKNSIHTIPFLPHWHKYGKAAGPIRNQEMLDKGQPHVCLAFPGGSGTADMKRRALAFGIPVYEYGVIK